MNKKKNHYIIRTIDLILKIILVLMLFLAIFNHDFLWSFFIGIMIIISLIPVLVRVYLKISLPYLFDFFICLAFIFHIDFSVFNILGFIPYYNKFTHFFSAVVVAFIFLIILFILDEYHRGVAVNKFKIIFDVIVITMAFGVVWEFMEWLSDRLFGWNTQPNLNDTMGDLLADTMGGVLIGIVGYFLIRKDIVRSFSKDFKKYFDKITEDD